MRSKLDPGVLTGYQFVSVCGRELNFVNADVVPIVFHSLAPPTAQESQKNNSRQGAPIMELVYGHNLRSPLCPSALWMDEEGKVFHPAPSKGGGGENALLRTHLVQEMVEKGILGIESETGCFFALWAGIKYLVPVKKRQEK